MLRFTFMSFLLGLLTLAGCIIPPKTTVPMETTWIEQVPGATSDTLFVFLPGRFDKPQDFIENGFLKDMRTNGIDGDAVIANAHLGYYYKRNLDVRLLEDVIQPAVDKGYTKIWAVGVSLGGFGAVMVERQHPGTWNGIVLIAPFTGDDEGVLEEVLRSDSLDDVSFKKDRTADDYTANFWVWMRDYVKDPPFPIFLGYGTEDRMAAEQARLGRTLPDDRVITVSGGHKWPVWEEIWADILFINQDVF